MPSSTDCWGIEVGAHAIKAIRLQRTGTETTVAEFDVIPYKKVLTTPDIDVDETIRLGLDQLMSRHAMGRSTIVVSVPGHMAFARFAKLPPVEPKRIPDIVKFEAMQQIPFPIEQVEWDYQTFQHSDSPDVEVGIFAITKERVLTWLSNFHAVGMPVHALTLSPLAVYNAMAYDLDLGDGPGTILMDIGTSSTDLIIVESGRIWLRTIPIGGHQFTEALVRSFKLSYSKAEKIKREAATSKYARQIFQAMRPIFVDLVNEVQKSLGYYQSLNRDASLGKLIGLGSTFRLPGLQKFLKQQLQMEVTRLDNFKKVEAEGRTAAEFAEQSVSLATAYGLALQGIELEKVSCNILPSGLIRRQIWKSKQPYNVAAALIIALSAGLAYGRLWWDQKAYESQAAVRGQIQSVINEANDASKKLSTLKGNDPRLKIENLRRILDYRNVWPAIISDVQQALAETGTQPDLLQVNEKKKDLAKIRAIPRAQRRQIFIDSLSYKYEFKGTDPFAEQQAVLLASGEFGGMPTPPPPPTPDPAATPAVPGAAPGKLLPSYRITVTGSTPREDGPRFLNATFVKWLKANGKRDDRPYHILEANVDSQMQGSAGSTLAGPGIGGPGGPGQIGLPGGPTPLPGLNTPSGLPGLKGLPTEAPLAAPIAPAIGANGEKVRTIDSYFPVDPLANEEKGNDWHFTISWRVELLPPYAARKTDLEGGDNKPPETPGATPPAPAPAAPKPAVSAAPAPGDPATNKTLADAQVKP